MNFVKLADEIAERYRRYLRTTFYFRDQDLRASFDSALVAGGLSKGPYLEATSTYRKGVRTAELFTELLDRQPEPAFISALHGDRLLYEHQEEAIRRIDAGQNVVVATGTGSGKTESFLYPILLHLYRQTQRQGSGRPAGVRALILYPMNALAYDQRDRLGAICAGLADRGSAASFSFGQYIGATPEDRQDRRRRGSDVQGLPGELVFRRQMRETPPDILLTNYSMLEYQLIRPSDSPLFDGSHARTWTFLVLDEAHQYRGIRGAEMGLLLRRLKQRLRASGHDEPFRCIATSASLSGSEAKVASFASDLFGERFDAENVVVARTEDANTRSTGQLTIDDYRRLRDHVIAAGAADAAVQAGQQLAEDSRVSRLRMALDAKPLDVSPLAEELFPELAAELRTDALSTLTELLNRAERPLSSGPFLSARYHLFLRALEGAFVKYHPTKAVTLTRQDQFEGGRSFELALCRECGQHYLVGKSSGGFLAEAVRDPTKDDFGASFFRPVASDDDADEDGEDTQSLQLCTQCGAIGAECPHSGQDTFIAVEKLESSPEQADQLKRCASCGYEGQDPVREVIYGGDGPNAMIATALFDRLEQEPKKILAFADSRQEAAYFAWYLDDTHKGVLRRSGISRSIRAGWAVRADPLSLRDLADVYRRDCEHAGLFEESTSAREKLRRAWEDVYREFLTQEVRISLQGVGLVEWSIAWPPSLDPPNVLLESPWGLNREQAFSVMRVLIDRLRADRAVEIIADDLEVEWTKLVEFGKQRSARLGSAGEDQARFVSWNSPRGWRASFLAKALQRRGFGRDNAIEFAEKTLRQIWQHLCAVSDRQDRSDAFFVQTSDGRRSNSNWWRVRPLAPTDRVFRCDTCTRVQNFGFEHTCPHRGCSGRLIPVEAGILADNHYRVLYEGEARKKLRVEEHTAQLATDEARKIQRDFQEGRVNLLSSSTTFELGVDLGDLSTVFLRNVPPEPFNYVQRVGRAGRRAGLPGFAVTYCRRGPHDLYHFSDPTTMMSGRSSPPTIALDNHRVSGRHLIAMVLGDYFRQAEARFENVEALVGDWLEPDTASQLKQLAEERRNEFERGFANVFPRSVWQELGLADGSWIVESFGEGGRLGRAVAEVASDFRRVNDLEQRASQERRYKDAEWAKDRKNTISREDVLSFLSRKAVIPKYGFPVDVVELDTQRTGGPNANSVSLSRDLAIAIGEFAPSASLIAAKAEWTSYGLKTVPDKALDRRMYRVCRQHNLMVTWNNGESDKPLPCACRALAREYVIPSFGFVTETNRAPKPKPRRPVRMFTTRPYFLRRERGSDENVDVPGSKGMLAVLTKSFPGRMAVLCEGRKAGQFLICNTCGAGFLKQPKGDHKTPWGRQCGARLSRLSLGHEFTTDVVQIQFHHPAARDAADEVGFGLGVANALLYGIAEALSVPSTDLNVTIGQGGFGSLPTIILYDDVPGGAGLVARIENRDVLRRGIEAAHERVSGRCDCGDDTSCYGCLRSYRNQFAHTLMKRGPVKAYFEQLLQHWPVKQ